VRFLQFHEDIQQPIDLILNGLGVALGGGSLETDPFRFFLYLRGLSRDGLIFLL
jgi:hypothetical protein